MGLGGGGRSASGFSSPWCSPPPPSFLAHPAPPSRTPQRPFIETRNHTACPSPMRTHDTCLIVCGHARAHTRVRMRARAHTHTHEHAYAGRRRSSRQLRPRLVSDLCPAPDPNPAPLNPPPPHHHHHHQLYTQAPPEPAVVPGAPFAPNHPPLFEPALPSPFPSASPCRGPPSLPRLFSFLDLHSLPPFSLALFPPF